MLLKVLLNFIEFKPDVYLYMYLYNKLCFDKENLIKFTF